MPTSPNEHVDDYVVCFVHESELSHVPVRNGDVVLQVSTIDENRSVHRTHQLTVLGKLDDVHLSLNSTTPSSLSCSCTSVGV